MSTHREALAFAAVSAALVAGFLAESLIGGKVLSPADVLFVSASFREQGGPLYEPENRLLTDPVLQFQPWLEFNRALLRRGRLPLWNTHSGCGAPHLANGQSAVFDPFQLLAYFGRLPEAHAWMAGARLWTAGLGMFLLARAWGFGGWGRWFSGLTFPFCGFLVVWLLYPVTGAAVWLPWLFWATDRVLNQPRPRTIAGLALIVGCTVLAGHVQTSAHVLLAGGLYAVWQVVRARPEARRRALAAWTAGTVLGLSVAAIEIVPLAGYLSKSPVWADRAAERRPPWTLTRPRLLDAACTALPYAFGSQRRGHPNLARALGAHNLNESAGGYAGLATLIWLAPLAWATGRRRPEVGFAAVLAGVGALGAFGLPPIDNLLRVLPVLNVTDNRRLTLWVAFGLTLLGGAGLDALGGLARTRRLGEWGWAASALGLCFVAAQVGRFEPVLKARASTHYARAASLTAGADPVVYQGRADRQARQVVEFVPRYLVLVSAQLFGLALLARAWRRGLLPAPGLQAALLGLTLLDLFGFGRGLNPALGAPADRPVSPVIDYLRREVGPSGRVLGLGEELPPNTLMRYGLNDVRNYDSIELGRSLAWFAPLYEPGRAARTSRRATTWAGALRARDRLRDASTQAIVAASPPPAGAFAEVERVGAVWVARLDGRPLVSAAGPATVLRSATDHGRIDIVVNCPHPDRVIVRETYDPGWRVEVDGRPSAIEAEAGAFLAVPVAAGARVVRLRYDPPEVRVALAVSLGALAVAGFGLTEFSPFRSTRIRTQGLGSGRPIELESDDDSQPDFSTG